MQIKLQLICSPPQPVSLQKTGSSMNNLCKAARQNACHSWQVRSYVELHWEEIFRLTMRNDFIHYIQPTIHWTLSEKSLTETIEELNTERVLTKINHEPWLVILEYRTSVFINTDAFLGQALFSILVWVQTGYTYETANSFLPPLGDVNQVYCLEYTAFCSLGAQEVSNSFSRKVLVTEHIGVEMKFVKLGDYICPLSWTVHCNFVRDGKYSKRGWTCTPHPHQPELIFPSWWKVRQKSTVATLCVLCGIRLLCEKVF